MAAGDSREGSRKLQAPGNGGASGRQGCSLRAAVGWAGRSPLLSIIGLRAAQHVRPESGGPVSLRRPGRPNAAVPRRRLPSCPLPPLAAMPPMPQTQIWVPPPWARQAMKPLHSTLHSTELLRQ